MRATRMVGMNRAIAVPAAPAPCPNWWATTASNSGNVRVRASGSEQNNVRPPRPAISQNGGTPSRPSTSMPTIAWPTRRGAKARWIARPTPWHTDITCCARSAGMSIQ